MELAPKPHYKALGGSFKLVTLAPRTVSEMTQLLKETQKKSLSSQSLGKYWYLKQNNQETAHIAMKTNNT